MLHPFCAHPRVLTLPTQAEYEALRQARQRQPTDAFLQRYHVRAGVEGLISQAVNSHGLRRSRYRGLAKTRLQHVVTPRQSTSVGLWLGSTALHAPEPVSRLSRRCLMPSDRYGWATASTHGFTFSGLPHTGV